MLKWIDEKETKGKTVLDMEVQEDAVAIFFDDDTYTSYARNWCIYAEEELTLNRDIKPSDGRFEFQRFRDNEPERAARHDKKEEEHKELQELERLKKKYEQPQVKGKK